MEESQMGFISYGKYTFASFLSSIIFPYLRHSNHSTNDCEFQNFSGIKQEESDCNTTPASHVSILQHLWPGVPGLPELEYLLS